jgi:hypothetical protein
LNDSVVKRSIQGLFEWMFHVLKSPFTLHCAIAY